MSFVRLGQDGSQVYIYDRAAGHHVPDWVDRCLRDEWEEQP